MQRINATETYFFFQANTNSDLPKWISRNGNGFELAGGYILTKGLTLNSADIRVALEDDGFSNITFI